MITYILYFIFIIVIALYLNGYQNGRNWFLILSIGLMWLMIGLRSIDIGYDTRDYVQAFLTANSFSFSDTKEPLFWATTSFIRLFTDNYNIYFLLIQSAYCISLFLLLKRHLATTIESLIAITLIFLLGIYAFSASGLRQTIAIGFVILAFLTAEKEKWFAYALCIAIAFGFHNSSLMMAPMFLLRKVNLNRVAIPMVIAMFIVAQVMPENIVELMYSRDSILESRYGNYGTIYESKQNYSGFILQLILVIMVFIRRNKINLPSETKNFFFNMAYLGLGFQSMTVVIAEFFRISLYFCIFDIVLVPIALTTFTRNKKIIYSGFMIGCLIYIFLLAKGNVMPMSNMAI